MSSLFGPIAQVAYVVNDLEATMHDMVDQGIGPFFHTEFRVMDDFRYHGVESKVEMACALGNSGPLQIELIQQLNDAPSMFKDFIDAGGDGVQHIAYWTHDYDALYDKITSLGYVLGQDGVFGAPEPYEPARFCYFEPKVPGPVIEIADTSGMLGPFFTMIREAAEGWDGADPVRPMPV